MAVDRLLARGVRFTAIFAANDQTAIGAMLALFRSGVQVGRDVSLVGFDDQPSAAYTCPPLTTIRQPAVEMGMAAARALVEELRGSPLRPADFRHGARSACLDGAAEAGPAPGQAARGVPGRPHRSQGGSAELDSIAAGRAHPALWVPSLYFAMGTPMTAVSVMSAVMYKNLGLSNAEIALYTGSMYLPWVRQAALVPPGRDVPHEAVLRAGHGAGDDGDARARGPGPGHCPTGWPGRSPSCGSRASPPRRRTSRPTASTSASLGHREQAAYVGVQGVFWNLGRIIATGVLVSFTGILHGRMGLSWLQAWMVVMAALAR